MGFPRLTLVKVITLVVLAVFTLQIGFTLYQTVQLQYLANKEALISHLKLEVGVLARNSERMLRKEPALLKEDFAQMASESHVLSASIIDDNEIIWVAKHFDTITKPIDQAFSPALVTFLREARDTRVLKEKEGKFRDISVVWLAMSFNTPQNQHNIRNSRRGIIFFSCNSDLIYQEAFANALRVAGTTFALLLMLTVVLLLSLHAWVARPIQNIAKYVKEDNIGSLDIKNAPSDLRSLGHAISLMRQALSNQFTKIKEDGELNRLILENTDDGFITIDPRGIILSVSPPAEKIFGYTEIELKDQNISMLMPSPYREQHDGYLEHYHRTGERRTLGYRRVVTGLRKSGETFPLELRVQEMKKQSEILFVGSVRDLSERVALDKAKNEFVSTVSHELRTPLTAINGSISLILGTAAPQLPENVLNLLNVAQRNGQRLLQLINDLLDMEKLLAGKMSMNFDIVEAGPLVQQGMELLTPLARQVNKALVAHITDTPAIRVDPDRFQQALSNLMSNALKYSGDAPEVTVQVVAENDIVTITVSDQGPGIPESFRDRLFTKFAQGDSSDTRKQGGTGLGLAITKLLVEQMGGQITYRPGTPHGANFDICFYAVMPDAQA